MPRNNSDCQNNQIALHPTVKPINIFKADEEFPQWINTSAIVYLKTTYKNIPTFYARNINTGRERKIAIKDISVDSYFSYRNGKIIYAVYKPDARWDGEIMD